MREREREMYRVTLKSGDYFYVHATSLNGEDISFAFEQMLSESYSARICAVPRRMVRMIEVVPYNFAHEYEIVYHCEEIEV